MGGYALPVIILLNLPWGGFQALGIAAIFLLMAITSLGAAGLAGLMGQRLQTLGLNASDAGATVRGAVAMELAAVFPIIGWFIFIPVAFVISLGATAFALIGWTSRPKIQTTPAKNRAEVLAST